MMNKQNCLCCLFALFAVVTTAQTFPIIWYAVERNLILRDKTGHHPAFLNPTANDNLLNFNHSCHLDGTNPLTIRLRQQDLSEMTLFVVYQAADSTQEQGIWCLANLDTCKMIVTTHRMAQLEPVEYINFIDQPKSGPQINTYSRYGVPFAQPLTQHLTIGAPPVHPKLPVLPFRGTIAEMIVFNQLLDYEAILQVQSYLALKFGIHLENSYFNAAGQVMWDFERNQTFSQRITGIGRDDKSGLYQRQSTNNLITIGAERIAPTNEQNTARFDDNTYLIWGDNNKDLYFENKSLIIKPLNRKWLITVHPKSGFPTTLKVDINQIRSIVSPNEPYYLLIDRCTKTDFDVIHADTLRADSLDQNGFAYFNQVQWDVDGSGSDVFSIGTKAQTDLNHWTNINKGNFKNVSLYPNPTEDGHFTLRIDIYQKKNIKIQIYNLLGDCLFTKSLIDSDFYIYEGQLSMVNATYLVQIIDDATSQTFKMTVFN
jgi:hypothetical protein